MAIFLYVPLAVMTVFAFDDSHVQTLPWSGFTTRWFHAAFSNGDLIAALQRSASIGLATAGGSTLLALITALGMTSRRLAFRGLITALVLLPLVIPYIVLAVGLLILLNWLGLHQALWAVLLGHVGVSMPYCVLIILPRLRTLDEAIFDAARDLGAGPWSAFRRVTLPLTVPAIVSSAIIAFTISFDEYAIASFLVPAGQETFPVYVYSGSRTPALEPQILALGSVVVAFSLVLVTLAEVVRKRAERRLATA
ncbi:MAG TPA: ABC transporter permease [Gaiellaceae bacterium]|nr:ABC transporter permease [Gaiellaceae bacterium]